MDSKKIVQVEVRIKNVRTSEKRVVYLDMGEDGMLNDSNLLRLLTQGATLWGAGWDVSEFSIDRVNVSE